MSLASDVPELYETIVLLRKGEHVKKCPFCAEDIQDEAIKCRHCSEMLVSHPSAPVELAPVGDVGLALWDPNTAANWSIIFSPAFGAYLHMKNWQELGKPKWALWSRLWIIACVVAGPLLGTFSEKPGGVALLILLVWYFSSARAQVRYVSGHVAEYRRKGWGAPIGVAVAIYAISFACWLASTQTWQ